MPWNSVLWKSKAEHYLTLISPTYLSPLRHEIFLCIDFYETEIFLRRWLCMCCQTFKIQNRGPNIVDAKVQIQLIFMKLGI